MFRHLLWLVLIIALTVLPRDAPYAQQNVAPTPGIPTAAPTGQAALALSPDQARAALDTLNDPKKRAAFAATLEALIKAHPDAAPATPTPTPTPATPPPQPGSAKSADEAIDIQLAPNSLGAQVLLTASSFLNDIAGDVPRAFQAVQSLPLLWGWVFVMFTHPLGQQLLLDLVWRLLATLALALSVAEMVRYLLRRPMARLCAAGQYPTPAPVQAEDAANPRTEPDAQELPPRRRGGRAMARRIGLGLARFALQLIPIVGLLLGGHLPAAVGLGGLPSSRLVVLAVLEAIAAGQILLAILTFLFEPEPPGLKLLPMRPSAGAYLMRWGRRLILIAVPGYTIGEIGLLLGLSPQAHDALQKAVGLVLVICLGLIVVQRRRPVRRWLSAPPESTGVLAQIRNRLAKFWYWVALFFLAATWLSWAVRAPDAVGHTLWYFGATVLVIAAASLARVAINSLLRPLRPNQDPGQSALPAGAFRSRLSVYYAAISELAQIIISVIALLALLQLYGLPALTWVLTSQVGNRIASGFVTLIITIGLAFAAWEGVNIVIQMRMDVLRREAQVARSARLRTLLPLIRTTLAITVAVVAGLMVLSEIGVNIAPLLAGAGIVGVAIGFGSQKLVQDVITGVFLLLENTMQVGDIVKVGDQSGLVESLSVRTIRLRTEDGSVVVIPFSAVTTVINMTRDYSRAVMSVPISIEEDTDLVIDQLRGIVKEMRSEDAWSTIILDDLEVFGLDQFTNSALLIRCRVMCTPFGRWPVGREFNRRLKTRFETVGITSAASALKLPSAPVVMEEKTQPEPPMQIA
jgi:moderate conductance mechanosensitive channel